MKRIINLDKDSIIDFILFHDKKIHRDDLVSLSLDSLILIKVQVEIENLKNNNKHGKVN